MHKFEIQKIRNSYPKESPGSHAWVDVYLGSLGDPLDPLLENGHVLVRQVPDHLVQLLPLLQVPLSTTDTVPKATDSP